jgi:hypothetical protein
VLAVVVAAGAGGAWAARNGPVATGVTFELVSPPQCAAPQVVLGSACVDKSGLVVADKWTVGAGSAQWNVPGQWQTSYEWTVPESIPPAGAKLTMKMTGTELIGGANNRICPAMGARGGFEFKGEAQPVTLGFCAEAGGTKSDTKTVTLVPSSAAAAGTIAYLTVGAQDGPSYTYTYRAGASTPACPPALRSPASSGADDKCRYFVRFNFEQHRDPIRGDLNEITSVGVGRFGMDLPAGATKSCSLVGLFDFRARHLHEQIAADDVGIQLVADPRTAPCLRIIKAGKKVEALRVGFGVVVAKSTDAECERGTSGSMVIRAGRPFPYVVFDVCGHTHVYSPSRLSKNPTHRVEAAISVRPA